MARRITELQTRLATTDEQVRILEMAEEDADEVLDALASDNGRQALRSLFADPATPSELACRLDTSVQNIHYHLSNLRDAGLVEPIDTVYSEKGNEMTVYGPANDPLVFVGDRARLSSVRRSLTDVVSGLGILAAASLLIQWGAERLVRSGTPASDIVGPAGRTPEPSPAHTLGWLVFEVIEPGVLFFAGCLVIAGIVVSMLDR